MNDRDQNEQGTEEPKQELHPLPVDAECFRAIETQTPTTLIRAWRERGLLGPMVYWRAQWFEWSGSHYRPITETEAEDRITLALDRSFAFVEADPEETRPRYRYVTKAGEERQAVPMQITKAIIANMIACLRPLVSLQSDLAAPFWIDDGRSLSPDLVPVVNGTLDTSTGELHPSTPKAFVLAALATPYVRGAQCPEWLAMLDRIWPGDPESHDLLQAIFAYVLFVRGNPRRKFFQLIGSTTSGKGLLLRLLRALVGEQNYGAFSVNRLERSFELGTIATKMVCADGDVRIERERMTARLATLLSMTGGDTVQIERKYHDPISVPFVAKVILATNSAESFGERSGALAARRLVLAFVRSFAGIEDLGLIERLMSERSGILNWALEGLADLKAHGFVQPESAFSQQERIAENEHPVRVFVDSCCDVGPTGTVKISDLHAAYNRWAVERDAVTLDHAPSFTKEIKAIAEQATTRVASEGKGAHRRSVRYLDGIALKPDVPVGQEPETATRSRAEQAIADHIRDFYAESAELN